MHLVLGFLQSLLSGISDLLSGSIIHQTHKHTQSISDRAPKSVSSTYPCHVCFIDPSSCRQRFAPSSLHSGSLVSTSVSATAICCRKDSLPARHTSTMTSSCAFLPFPISALTTTAPTILSCCVKVDSRSKSAATTIPCDVSFPRPDDAVPSLVACVWRSQWSRVICNTRKIPSGPNRPANCACACAS